MKYSFSFKVVIKLIFYIVQFSFLIDWTHGFVNFADVQCGLQTPLQQSNANTNLQHGRKAKVSGHQVESTYAGEFPFLVSFSLNNQGKHFCGGFIISKKFILSAAHCFTDFVTKVPPFPYRWMEVLLGENVLGPKLNASTGFGSSRERSRRKSIANVAEIRVHPEFNEADFRHDIALIELEEEIEWSPYKQPICLPSPKDLKQNPYSFSHVAGWGSLSENTLETSSVLKKAAISPIYFNSEDCQKAYDQLSIKVHETHLCAGGDQEIGMLLGNKSEVQKNDRPDVSESVSISMSSSDSCYGDSGGPLMVRDEYTGTDRGSVLVAIGIVSSSRGCSRGYPSLYSKIAMHLPWIQSYVKTDVWEETDEEKIKNEMFMSLTRSEDDKTSVVIEAVL